MEAFHSSILSELWIFAMVRILLVWRFVLACVIPFWRWLCLKAGILVFWISVWVPAARYGKSWDWSINCPPPLQNCTCSFSIVSGRFLRDDGPSHLFFALENLAIMLIGAMSDWLRLRPSSLAGWCGVSLCLWVELNSSGFDETDSVRKLTCPACGLLGP